MKIRLVVTGILYLALASCQSVATKDSNTTGEAVESNMFACPMACEGEKTYAEAGTCPVCEMDLEDALAHTEAHPEH